MTPGRWSRQEVTVFLRRLSTLAQMDSAPDTRLHINRTGSQTKSVSSRNDAERFVLYGARRQETVARLFAHFEIARDVAPTRKGGHRYHVERAPAVWQAFRGTKEHPACHTAPTHLRIDKALPTLITNSIALRQHMIVDFADCMLMPASVNRIDSVIDVLAGKEAFAKTSELLLNKRGMTWDEGLSRFREAMREPLYLPNECERAGQFTEGNDAAQTRLAMLEAYYEGLFLRSANGFGIENMKKRICQEIEAEQRTAQR